MKIVAITFGTEGDWRPLAVLCQGLAAAGHSVTLLGPREAGPLAAALGVECEALEGDMGAELHAAMPILARSGSDAAAMSRVLTGFAVRHTGAWMRAALRVAGGADVLLYAGLAVYVGLSCAERLRIRAIGVALQPIMPTRAFPSPFVPPIRLPGWANRVTHRIVLAMMWRAFRGATDAARATLTGQPPMHSDWTDNPVLFGISPTLVPPPPDWPARFAVTGDWPTPIDPAWQAEPSLTEFLDAGEPPIYVGFGSMLGFDRARAQRHVLDALAGRRAVISSGPGGLGDGRLPAGVVRIGPTPHRWLLPRVRMAVHHGGAGTTHAAARAGVPMVVVPFAADQHFWGDRVQRLGIAPAPLPFRSMTAPLLRARMDAASVPSLALRARSIGVAMANEDGVRRAVAAFERLAQRKP